LAVKLKTLQKMADWSKLIGITIITLSIIVSFIDGFDLGVFNSTVGGIGFGALLAFIVPFWLGRISKSKTFRTFI
jgi:hypothetical protein